MTGSQKIRPLLPETSILYRRHLWIIPSHQIYNVEESSVKVQNQRIHEEYVDDESFRELFATNTTTPHLTIKDFSYSVDN